MQSRKPFENILVLLAHREQINLALLQHFLSCPKFHFSIKIFVNNITENIYNSRTNKKIKLRITFFQLEIYKRSQV